MFNYPTKNAKGLDSWKFAKKLDLASLKPETDKLEIGNSETIPLDFKE